MRAGIAHHSVMPQSRLTAVPVSVEGIALRTSVRALVGVSLSVVAARSALTEDGPTTGSDIGVAVTDVGIVAVLLESATSGSCC